MGGYSSITKAVDEIKTEAQKPYRELRVALRDLLLEHGVTTAHGISDEELIRDLRKLINAKRHSPTLG